MAALPELYCYRFSVFSWIARWALHEKGVACRLIEIDPFDTPVAKAYLAMNPFCRVPTLVHGGVTLYETSVIAEYIDEAFDGPELMPRDPAQRARTRQIMAIAGGDAYWPLVRQVFVHGFWRERSGERSDPAELEAGLRQSAKVLAALEPLVAEGPFLVGDRLTLADIHLAPMLSYFCETSEGAAICARYPALAIWWKGISEHSGYRSTRPDLTGPLE